MATRVIDEGLARIAQVVMDDISHAAVGSGTTTPTQADTALETETDRVSVTKTLRSGATLQIRTLFTNANLPATLEEVGWFMNASGTPDSGEMVVRSTQTFVKGSDDLLLIIELDIQES